MAPKSDGGNKLLADNRKARFNYTILERLEVGISLQGTEVKSMRMGKFSFTDAYAKISKAGELILVGFHISPYPFGNIHNHDPDRNRTLLAHKHEITKMRRKVDEKGCTLVPLKFYLKEGKVKLELGVATGRKSADKREVIKQRDEKRSVEREFRQRF